MPEVILALTDVTPRIVFDAQSETGGPTGPPHFVETYTTGPDPWRGSGQARAKGGGFDHSNTLPGDFGKMDGFDVSIDLLTEDLSLVTALGVHCKYSCEIEYTDSPLTTEPPVSDPPVGLLGMFLRPTDSHEYRGTFSEDFVSSFGWSELHRIGCETGGTFTVDEQLLLSGFNDLNFVAAQLADGGHAMTLLVQGYSPSEIATITIKELWLVVTYDDPAPLVDELDIEDLTGQFMRSY